MNSDPDVNSRLDLGELQAITDRIRGQADGCQGDPLAILQLLRILEALHREIREGLFVESLPNNRQDLYSLLREIEASGGWPYINRMKLRSLLTNSIADGGDRYDSDDNNARTPTQDLLAPGSSVTVN